MTEPVTTITIATICKHGCVALFGAIVHAVNAHRGGESKGFFDFVLLTIVSSFSGMIFAFVALYLFENPYITLAMTGAGGYLGTEGITWLSKQLMDMLSERLSKNKE